jgi:hypothetical protein
MFVTEFKFGENRMSEIQKIVQDIAKVDSSFRFALSKGVLEVFSDNKNTAYRRGVWLKNKAVPFNHLHFNVFAKV